MLTELWLPLSPEGCVVNSTHIFLDGLLINIDTWETINILVKMRFGFACGMVENEVCRNFRHRSGS